MKMLLQGLVRRPSLRGWSGWPDEVYKRESYQLRLAAVHEHLTECLDIAPRGGIRIVSICSGDGRDVLGVLESHLRAADVTASLIELDAKSVAEGERRARSAGLESPVRFLNADATIYETYQGIAHADIILVCGVWGHVPPAERVQLVRALECFCTPGGRVIWTRGVSKGLHRLGEIETHFSEPNWKKIRASVTADGKWGVVTQQYVGPLKEAPKTGPIFHFTRNSGR